MGSPRHRLTQSGRGWYKSVAGRTRWICSVQDAPTGAEADAIFEERFQELCNPPAPRAGFTVRQMFEAYIAKRRTEVESGNLSPRTLGDYADAGNRLVECVGDMQAWRLGAAHFAEFFRRIEHHSPGRRAKLAITIRTVFRASELPIDSAWLRLPRRNEFRLHKANRGPRLYAPADIGKLLKAASADLRAMILLALNGGLGNFDLATVPKSAVAGPWLNWRRSKTGIARQIPLWPETRRALAALSAHPSHLLFVRANGLPWIDDSGRSHKDWIAKEFALLCAAAGVVNRGFYSLRRTFRTLADEAGDQRAAAAIMGHECSDTGSIYVQRISDKRLMAVVNHVRAHIFARSRAPKSGRSKRR